MNTEALERRGEGFIRRARDVRSRMVTCVVAKKQGKHSTLRGSRKKERCDGRAWTGRRCKGVKELEFARREEGSRRYESCSVGSLGSCSEAEQVKERKEGKYRTRGISIRIRVKFREGKLG